MIPAFRATRIELTTALKEGGQQWNPVRNRLRGALVVSQVALSLVLLVVAALFTRSLEKLLSVDPGFRPEHVLVLSVDPRLFEQRMVALLTTLFGLLALLLAAVGLYGVMSYSVARRTREIGVRMALGAQRGDVTRLVLQETMTLVSAGGALGLAGALGAGREVSSLLFGLAPTDPAALVAAMLLLAGVAAVASYIPARRATKVDPLVALRYE